MDRQYGQDVIRSPQQMGNDVKRPQHWVLAEHFRWSISQCLVIFEAVWYFRWSSNIFRVLNCYLCTLVVSTNLFVRPPISSVSVLSMWMNVSHAIPYKYGVFLTITSHIIVYHIGQDFYIRIIFYVSANHESIVDSCWFRPKEHVTLEFRGHKNWTRGIQCISALRLR